mmetsp:Transcript_10196/g.17088  ORF Transcript_10196/g.17088 Transcript_10196/m.17088 type:complete len:227 (-) Transcript_10196:75-755(-)|eukprot:CAMPEP_0116548164 /NCGR_PEP_ID=MMETSP0397-20121206/4172_1 /TAXON_ID=216820 /ORGANISM="Cyclophora tenuis, Strain ECT3854" /LENGTH=226 /DNA_ID=CAMNT_0004072759 /DNA_START=72 /DNA_END=752 /DNA_ORIENTATION=+
MYFPARTIAVSLGSIVALAGSAVSSSVTPLTALPTCYDFTAGVTFTGPAVFVDNGNPGFSVGDFSIASSLTPVALPAQGSSLSINYANIAAICVVTTPGAAPSCNLEIDFEFTHVSTTFEGKLFAQGTGPEPYAITGGTDDLFGAFGQLDAVFSLSGGVTLANTLFTFCLFPFQGVPTQAPSMTPNPTPNPTPIPTTRAPTPFPTRGIYRSPLRIADPEVDIDRVP